MSRQSTPRKVNPSENGRPGKSATRIGSPILVKLSEVQPEPITWLWPGRVPIGKLTLLAGDPGLGKSLLSLDTAAPVSTGNGWPDFATEPERGGVVLLSAEDDFADTIRPRLDAAGADVTRINLIQAVEWFDGETGQNVKRSFCLERDIAALEEAIDQTADCRLVVVDPISAYLGRTDSHKNSDIRGLLAPLAELAQRRRVAVLAVTHLNKSAGPAMYRSTGSLAFVAAARAVWAVVQDKADARKRLFLPIKNNLGPAIAGLSYVVIERDGLPCLAWSADPVTVSADEAMAFEGRDSRSREKAEAAAWLQSALADGLVATTEIQRQAKESGLAWATVRRARKALGIIVYRQGFGPGAAWHWRLPSPPSGGGSPIAGIDAQFSEVSTYAASERLCDDPNDLLREAAAADEVESWQ